MNKRSFDRYAVDTYVECSVEARQHALPMYDLSMGGCMLETGNGMFAGGETVVIKLNGLFEAMGKVVWTGSGCTGVRFDHILHEAMVKHLGFVPSPLAFEEMEVRDRFGRLLPELHWASACQ